MLESAIIEVKEVKKKFRVYFDKGRTIKEKFLFKNRNRYEERWVLNGISFNVLKGEALGIIGENGCGKSTTLKLLTKIIYPDSGSIKILGRVSSLIELGAGFHPDMSGRENIYTNASIFGLTKKEIDNRIQDIIEFSELEEFLDNPVRTYSSGMYMRLAFSIAINVDADVLLIDEILAVGDANFQTKCFNKLRELKNKGMTIVLVTHDSAVIEKFCDKAIWINKGYIMSNNTATKVIDEYLKYMNDKRIESLIKKEYNDKNSEEVSINKKKSEESNIIDDNLITSAILVQNAEETNTQANHFGLGNIEIENAYFRNKKNEITNVLVAGEMVEIVICYKVNDPLDEYVFGMGFYDFDGKCIVGSNTQLDRITVPHKKMNGIVRFKIESLPLLSGRYILNVAIVDKNGTPLDFYRDYCHFDVISSDRNVGYISLQHEWKIE